jgi:hypothetical protein
MIADMPDTATRRKRQMMGRQPIVCSMAWPQVSTAANRRSPVDRIRLFPRQRYWNSKIADLRTCTRWLHVANPVMLRAASSTPSIRFDGLARASCSVAIGLLGRQSGPRIRLKKMTCINNDLRRRRDHACVLFEQHPSKNALNGLSQAVPLLRVHGPSVIVVTRRRGASRSRPVLGRSLKSLAFTRECPMARVA